MHGSEVVGYTENQITKLQTEENKALSKCKKMYSYKRIKGGCWGITSSNQRHEDKNPLYQTYIKRLQLTERNIPTTLWLQKMYQMDNTNKEIHGNFANIFTHDRNI